VQITDTVVPVENRRPELRSGIRIAFDSNGDLHNDPQRTAGNPDGNREIFVVRLSSNGQLVFTQVTDTLAPVDNVLGCTARGGRQIFFSSNGDLNTNAEVTYGNGDGSVEVFRYVGSARKETFTQMTNASSGESVNASCTPNGVWLAFESTADLENDGATNRRVFQMNTRKMSLLRPLRRQRAPAHDRSHDRVGLQCQPDRRQSAGRTRYLPVRSA
jgi:hypothetical protein